MYFIFLSFKSEDNPNYDEVSNTILNTFWVFLSIFFYCELGQTMADQFSCFDDELYQCDWYLFPIEVQQMLVILMSGTQMPMTVKGYANIVCTRESFKNVIQL